MNHLSWGEVGRSRGTPALLCPTHCGNVRPGLSFHSGASGFLTILRACDISATVLRKRGSITEVRLFVPITCLSHMRCSGHTEQTRSNKVAIPCMEPASIPPKGQVLCHVCQGFSKCWVSVGGPRFLFFRERSSLCPFLCKINKSASFHSYRCQNLHNRLDGHPNDEANAKIQGATHTSSLIVISRYGDNNF